jgi:sigma-B regulation protein RsbU (phosphoserine phosphatase)
MDTKDTNAELMMLRDELTVAKRKIVNLSGLVEISKIINSTLDLDALLSMIMEITEKVLNVESSSLLLIDEPTGELVCRVSHNNHTAAPAERFRLKIGEGIAGWVVQHKVPLFIKDLQRDKRVVPAPGEISQQKPRSVLCIPLEAQGRILGVIEAVNCKKRAGFTEEDMELFIAFSSQAAVAVESARVHARLLEQQRVAQELQIAHQIQQNFLPSTFPELQGARFFARTIPAWETGGDFFDFVDIGSGRIGAVIGDVSGKGVPAALYMVKTLSAFRFYALSEKQPDKLLNRLNKNLFEYSTSGMFVTLIYAIIDAPARTISFAIAGHLPIVWRKTSAKKTELIEGARGLPLGIDRDARYELNTLTMQRGDLLFFYTDGIIEARNKAGATFGMHRLNRLLGKDKLSAEQAVKQVLYAIARFSRGAPQHDDLTALAVKLV